MRVRAIYAMGMISMSTIVWIGDAFQFMNRPLSRLLQSSFVGSRRTAAKPIQFNLGRDNTGQGGGGSPSDNFKDNGDDDSQERGNTMVTSSQQIDWRRARQHLVKGFADFFPQYVFPFLGVLVIVRVAFELSIAKMTEGLAKSSELKAIDMKIDHKFKSVNEKIDNKIESVNNKIDNKFESLNNKIDNKIESVRKDILISVLINSLVTVAVVGHFSREKKK